MKIITKWKIKKILKLSEKNKEKYFNKCPWCDGHGILTKGGLSLKEFFGDVL